MADNETLDDRVYELMQVCTAIKKGQDVMHARLFVEGGGVIPNMQAAIIDKADAKEFATFKDKALYRAGFASGATTVGLFIVKWGASQLGLHWPGK